MEIHDSHDPVDVSDISLTIDVLCNKCSMKDEELREPCTADLVRP